MFSHYYDQSVALANLAGFALILGIGILALYRWKSKSLRFGFAVNSFLAADWCLSAFSNSQSLFKALYLQSLRLGSAGWILIGPCLFIFLAWFLGWDHGG